MTSRLQPWIIQLCQQMSVSCAKVWFLNWLSVISWNCEIGDKISALKRNCSVSEHWCGPQGIKSALIRSVWTGYEKCETHNSVGWQESYFIIIFHYCAANYMLETLFMLFFLRWVFFYLTNSLLNISTYSLILINTRNF